MDYLTELAFRGDLARLDEKAKAFVVTGLLYNSKKRFVKRYTHAQGNSTAYETAMMTNLWRGSVSAELDNGKRKLLKRVYN